MDNELARLDAVGLADLIRAGERFHQGVQGLKNAGCRAEVDANLVTAYRRAGSSCSGVDAHDPDMNGLVGSRRGRS